MINLLSLSTISHPALFATHINSKDIKITPDFKKNDIMA